MSGGFWVAADGPNGSGKSLTMKTVAERMRQLGFDVVETREPGGSPLAEQLREIILNSANKMDSMTQLALFNAARRSHLKETILPALADGKVVLCDRYLASSLVFQSLNPDGSPNLSDEEIINAHRRICDGHIPNFSIYFDAPLAVRRQRIAGRAGSPDRFEEYDDRFDIAAAEKFLKCGPLIDRDHIILDSTDTPEEVADVALNAILARHSGLSFGALNWSEQSRRWVAVTDPKSHGTRPILADTPSEAYAEASRALVKRDNPSLRVVTAEAARRAMTVQNLAIAA